MLEEFCDILQINKEALLGHSRLRELTEPRALYWKLLRERGYTLSAIARKTNRICHSTVIAGLKNINNLIETDRTIARKWEMVKKIEKR